MWTRAELKERAKAVLRQIYWSALGVSIVIALAGGNSSGFGGGGGNSHSNNSERYGYFNDYDHLYLNWQFVSIVLTIFAITIALRIFVGYSLEIGGRKYFIQSAQYKDNKNCFSFGFAGQNYGGIVKTMLLKVIYNFLWGLLLIIPGIIKSYAYRMVPYILAENPNIGANKAIALSNEMTRGHKFDMFVLDLSFIGWYILGALALGVGIIFVFPYENATKAELYLVLRKNALENNMCSYGDLLLTESTLDTKNDIW